MHARLAGLLSLVPLFLGPFSMMYVPSVVLVPGDAGATAAHLQASESLVRLGLASDALIGLTEVALTVVLYTLLRPAGRVLALTAMAARLAMTVLQGANLVPLLAALRLVTGGSPGPAFDLGQTQALALLCLDAHALGVHVWELFFALHCLSVGVLVFRSGYFPRALGVLMGLASVGYGLNGFGHLVAPAGAPLYAAVVAATSVVGEVPFIVWLLFKGVDAQGLRTAVARAGNA